MPSETITVVLPVYGRPALLMEALNSLLHQESSQWRLLIADDGSDQQTQALLKQWKKTHRNVDIDWVRRPRNLGLFANLNKALQEIESEWALLLCSDDYLHPTAIKTLQECRQRWTEAELILSTFDSINIDGSPRPSDSAWHHDQVSRCSALISPEQLIPALLELGSLNGNLTGMAFSRNLWQDVGKFRENWRHAADWEWLVRAAAHGPVVLNRIPIASVRTHDAQLSNSNRRSGHELREVAEVVCLLRSHPLLTEEPRRHKWAAEVMQHQLWNLIKQIPVRGTRAVIEGLPFIRKASGLRQTTISLLKSIPRRLRK
ncbi:beta-glycosyltransferase/ family 2 [Synechococcus sp. MIT S9220]|uniref:glycosyltransferase family 2 protein n=1 Tax=unclassified Synechococcus TaxID=2626047 RepID=UPI00164CDA9A|nr:glycosyltransferase family 2 protein [Synechococcus sp. MIT S9220]NOL48038.1 glycosyltransferase [Synechococcus sp. MIT S9220]QNJ21524.1 beta-glycosyltransferase/ family 2 [Synechococcus sp. MIT S9220]